MAKYCEDILGDYLLKRPLDSVPVWTIILEFTVLDFSLLLSDPLLQHSVGQILSLSVRVSAVFTFDSDRSLH